MTDKKISISKETIHRLLHDIKTIIRSPLHDHGIYYTHDEEDMMRGYALIVGPPDTPYFGGFYFFIFHFPTDYPHSPPLVIYNTNGDGVRFNPNLYVNGKVCISILNTWRGEQWTSCQTLTTVLLNLCTLLGNDPLLNEPGISKQHPDLEKYNRVIEFKNIDIAIIKMMKMQPEPFDGFYSTMKEYFLKNHDQILSFIEKKKAENADPECIIISIYSMNVCINYSRLYEKYMTLYTEINNDNSSSILDK